MKARAKFKSDLWNKYGIVILDIEVGVNVTNSAAGSWEYSYKMEDGSEVDRNDLIFEDDIKEYHYKTVNEEDIKTFTYMCNIIMMDNWEDISFEYDGKMHTAMFRKRFPLDRISLTLY